MADLGAAVGGQYFLNKAGGDDNFDDASEGDSNSDEEVEWMDVWVRSLLALITWRQRNNQVNMLYEYHE